MLRILLFLFLSAILPLRAISQLLTEDEKIIPSDGHPFNYFGRSANLSGQYAVIGAPGNIKDGSRVGSAYIYQRIHASWELLDKISAPSSGHYGSFGNVVAISGINVIVGAEGADNQGTSSGAAYVFELDSTGSWSKVEMLSAFDGSEYDYFGSSVSIDGDHAVVGAIGDDDSGSFSGAAYIFKKDSSGSWKYIQKMKGLDKGGRFGVSVAVKDNYMVIGAYLHDEGAALNRSSFHL